LFIHTNGEGNEGISKVKHRRHYGKGGTTTKQSDDVKTNADYSLMPILNGIHGLSSFGGFASQLPMAVLTLPRNDAFMGV